MPKISIIIPCYNEESVISNTLQKVMDFFHAQNWTFEIIVVDDGSTDKTVELAQKFDVMVLKNEVNRGKGYSVKKGVLASSGELLLFMDSDLSTPLEEIFKLLPFYPNYDVIIGSRAEVGAKVEQRQSWLKSMAGKIGNHLIRLFLGLKINDTQCGFKLFSARAKELFSYQLIERWGFDFELLFIAQKRGYKVREVGIRWINDVDSKVTLSGYFKTLAEVAKVRLNDWQGRYPSR